MSRFALLIAALAAFALPVTAPQAADPGWEDISAGQFITATAPRDVHQGPGTAYLVVDTIQPGEQLIITGECRPNWCEISHSGRDGWVYFPDAYAEGWEPDEGIFGTDLHWGRGGPGEVCFYEGTNYSGASFCLTSGVNYPDLALMGADNRISSVKVTGEVSTLMCKDANYEHYCVLLVQDHPYLDRVINNQASSITVY